MILITTALEEIFPKDTDKKVLFLGEWCKLYSKKDFYEQYNYEVLLYHWDDRNKLHNDTKYIDIIYEKYLIELKDNLNNIHKLDFSIEYWRIVVGPWLRYFIEMVYDRYLSIEKASKEDIDYVYSVNIKDELIVPNNMKDFSSIYIGDLWNQYIYQNIIEYFDIKVKKINFILPNNIFKDNKKVSIKEKLIDSFFFVNKLNKIHFFSSYIRLKNKIKLQLSLNQMPTIGNNVNIKLDIKYSNNLRDKLIFSKNNSLFEDILETLIKKQIPKYYLEGYSKFRKKVLKEYPKKAKIIFTANAYSSDDMFKFWVAEKKEEGSKYIIGQHGGHYGMGLFASHEKHHIKSSDKFFSWGWTLDNSKKVIPVSAIKLKRKIGYNKNGNILIPTLKVPRYSYHIYSIPIAGQLLNYINNQLDFIKLLPITIKKDIKFRTFENDYGWDIQNRLSDCIDYQIVDTQENLNKSFYKRLSECRLCISTYNATTYLETFSANYPTLLYWDSNYFELREEATKYFKLLEDVGILHHTAESLAKKVNEIYKDPLSWWHQDEIQKAKDYFCTRFANIQTDFIEDYNNEIEKLIES